MALLWCDGFEGRDVTKHYEDYNIWSENYSSSGRYGYGLVYNGASGSSNRYIAKNITASTDVYVGCAFYMDASNKNLYAFFGDAGATTHITILFTSGQNISIIRGGTTLATSTGTLPLNAWIYVEVHARVDDTTGSVEVRIDGSNTNYVSYSGDTKNAGTNNTIDRVRFYNAYSNSLIDDIYICDGTGSLNNTFLGEKRVQTLFPTGAGASTGLTPSTGSNYQNVDEVPASATDYNGSDVAGTRDTYAMTDLVAGTTGVSGVRGVMYAHKSDAGVASMKQAIRSGGTNYYGATQALTASMLSYNDIFETNPNTAAAWTPTEVNNAELGAEVV